MNIREHADYQKFSFQLGKITNVGSRMQQKLAAIEDVIPDLTGKDVLDIGCDFGFWSFLSAERGADKVVGLDRNRDVKGLGKVDLVGLNNETAKEINTPCEFHHIHVGEQWKTFGRFDVIYLMSLYHHIYNSCGDHLPIWFWLRNQIKDDGVVIWENPVDTDDVVSFGNIDKSLHANYKQNLIFEAASVYFEPEYIGPALHETTRMVYKLYPKTFKSVSWKGLPKHGAGGASKAFVYSENRRQKEVEKVLGYFPLPGSLNVILESPFHWDRNYYRAKVLDVKDRSKGLESEWYPRWTRFYPVKVNDIEGHVFRFENEKYPLNFIEVLSETRLRDHTGNIVNVDSLLF